MHSEVVDSHRFKLYLCCQAGTYIKEFVHSDFGRTRPSLGELLSDRAVDILSLSLSGCHWCATRMTSQQTVSGIILRAIYVCQICTIINILVQMFTLTLQVTSNAGYHNNMLSFSFELERHTKSPRGRQNKPRCCADCWIPVDMLRCCDVNAHAQSKTWVVPHSTLYPSGGGAIISIYLKPLRPVHANRCCIRIYTIR